MDHKQVATNVLNSVGGKENVKSLTHCVTRLRFTLKNTEIPNKAEVEKISGVMSVIEKGGQYQVVIGTEVESVYKEVTKIIGKQKQEIEEVEDGKEGSIVDEFLGMISGILLPTIGVLTACGVIKGLLTVLTVFKFLSADSGTYQVLSAIGGALFYFFPVILGSSAAQHFKMNQYTGMVIGASIIHPIITGLAGNGVPITFLGLPMNLLDYSQSVFPVIIAVWIAAKLEKALNKLVPKGFKFFLTSLIVLIVIVPLTLFVVGPASTFLSGLISEGVVGAYSISPILCGLLLGGTWMFIVMLGLHWAFFPIFIANIAAGGDPVMGLLASGSFATVGCCFAVWTKTKDKNLKNLALSSGITAIVGVSEPAIYGILMPYKKVMTMSVIGGGLGATVAAICGSKVYAFGASGILGLPGGLNPKGMGLDFYGYAGSMLAGFIFAFILTLLFGYKNSDKAKEEMVEKSA